MKLTTLPATLLVVAIQLVVVFTADVENGIAIVPGAFGVWYDCSQLPTKYISYALRVISAPAPGLTAKPDFGKTVKGSNPDPKTSAQFQNVLLTYQMTQKDLNIFLNGQPKYQMVPSLSCQEEPIRKCDRDTGTDLLDNNVIQCLAVVNPTINNVFMNLSISFNTSVFGPKAFTSPEVNTTTTASTPTSSAVALPNDTPTPASTGTPEAVQGSNAKRREVQGWAVVAAIVIGLIGLVGGI